MSHHAPQPAYVIRAAGPEDFAAVCELRDLAGPGFTSLSIGDEALLARLELSRQSYAARVDQPGPERYILLLESLHDQRIVGICAVKACVGETPPFFNFRVFKVAQFSQAAQRRFDLDVLILVNEFARCSEVGSLFVRPEARQGGAGRALAQSRYLLIGSAPERFCDRLVSELRGVVDEHGHSPFWEALGRHFFRMDFQEADRLSALTDNQFILDLMPKYPIYADLLSAEARAVIGKCHPLGEGAKRLLEWEGFRYGDVVDIFDAGPLLTAPRDSIRTLRESRRLELVLDESVPGHDRCLIARTDIANFRAVPCRGLADRHVMRVTSPVLEALQLQPGDPVLVYVAPHEY